MIKVTIFKDSQGDYRAFSVLGHADYGESGNDIVCAAVSMLSVNTVNAIDKYTKDTVKAETDDSSGLLTMSFLNRPVSSESKLLMDTLVMGLEDVKKAYREHIEISYREV